MKKDTIVAVVLPDEPDTDWINAVLNVAPKRVGLSVTNGTIGGSPNTRTDIHEVISETETAFEVAPDVFIDKSFVTELPVIDIPAADTRAHVYFDHPVTGETVSVPGLGDSPERDALVAEIARMQAENAALVVPTLTVSPEAQKMLDAIAQLTAENARLRSGAFPVQRVECGCNSETDMATYNGWLAQGLQVQRNQHGNQRGLFCRCQVKARKARRG